MILTINNDCFLKLHSTNWSFRERQCVCCEIGSETLAIIQKKFMLHRVITKQHMHIVKNTVSLVDTVGVCKFHKKTNKQLYIWYYLVGCSNITNSTDILQNSTFHCYCWEKLKSNITIHFSDTLLSKFMINGSWTITVMFQVKGKVPVLNKLSTMPWRLMWEWIYRSTFPWPWH
jgi:hypothetical protein